MSRHGISEGDGGWDEFDELRMWAATNATERAIKGKRGQAMLRELATALDAMPSKRLVRGSFERRADGEVCALGCLGRARGVDMSELQRLAEIAERDEDDPYDDWGIPRTAADAFGVARSLAQEVMYQNDDGALDNTRETPETRWLRMRAWVARQLGEYTP